MRRSSGARRAFTLLEMIVVMALMALVVALVAPSLRAPPLRGNELARLIASARGAAITRGQSLALVTSVDGAWSLRPLPPDDSVAIASGRLDRAPSRALRLRLAPLGSCIAEAVLPPELGPWDAGSCTPATGETASR
jgi:prepilin-type N-terminal cleavage/methylation domain-containing protein